MSQSARRVVLVTGASSGIGSAVAEEYSRRGARVALLARRIDRLEALATRLGDAIAVQADVCSDQSVDSATKQVVDTFGRVDVVVANAGVNVSGDFESLSLEDYRRQFEVNVFGVLRTVRAALPHVKATRGSIAVVGSISGFVSAPGFTPYSMSKYAVRAFAEGLGAELASAGVSVTHVAPGFVESEIRTLDNRGKVREQFVDPVPSWIIVPREKAAREIVDAIDARRPEAVITAHGRAAASISRHLPRLVHEFLKRARPLIPKL